MPTTLIITNDFPPRIGGIESFIGDICELLDGDVVVYASGPPGSTATTATATTDSPNTIIVNSG